MSDDSSRELQPVAALRRAATSGAVSFLALHPVLRSFLGALGAILFVIGVVTAPLWNVPILSWLSGAQVAGTCLAGGLGALGIWYLSGRRSAVREVDSTRGAGKSDLVSQLERLKQLHDSGELTNEEYERAKSQVLG